MQKTPTLLVSLTHQTLTEEYFGKHAMPCTTTKYVIRNFGVSCYWAGDFTANTPHFIYISGLKGRLYFRGAYTFEGRLLSRGAYFRGAYWQEASIRTMWPVYSSHAGSVDFWLNCFRLHFPPGQR